MDANQSAIKSATARQFLGAAAANITDHDPEEVPCEDARDFFVGETLDGEPVVHAPQMALE